MQQRLPTIKAVSSQFGGELSKGKRKSSRPIATKRAMHVVLRARESKLHSETRAIEDCLYKISRENDVRIYRFSNNNNHLHMIVYAKHRGGFQRFLRVFAGRVAQLVSKAVKGHKLAESFWSLLPWTRIVAWGRAFGVLHDYVEQNQLEAAGVVPYRPRSAVFRQTE